MSQAIVSLFWIVIAIITGFLISATFSGWLKLSRRLFLFPYIIFSSVLLVIFFCTQSVSFDYCIHNSLRGFISMIVVSAFLIRNILSQPFTREKNDKMFLPDLLWFGLAYGVIDGLLLNVMPVTAINLIIPSYFPEQNVSNRIIIGSLALIASLVVTMFYHLGYTEFRNKSVFKVLIRNALITLTFIISGNPLAAVLSHTIMHVAAVMRGPETTIQLPPHYQKSLET